MPRGVPLPLQKREAKERAAAKRQQRAYVNRKRAHEDTLAAADRGTSAQSSSVQDPAVVVRQTESWMKWVAATERVRDEARQTPPPRYDDYSDSNKGAWRTAQDEWFSKLQAMRRRLWDLGVGPTGKHTFHLPHMHTRTHMHTRRVHTCTRRARTVHTCVLRVLAFPRARATPALRAISPSLMVTSLSWRR